MARIKMHIPKAKLPFYPPYEVKCRLQNGVSTIPSQINSLMYSSKQSNLNDLLDKENLMWKQRARALFLKCGDRNTGYFHSKASHRCRRNKISGLRNPTNAWCTTDKQIKDIAVDYFHSLFSSSLPSEQSEIFEAVKPSVT